MHLKSAFKGGEELCYGINGIHCSHETEREKRKEEREKVREKEEGREKEGGWMSENLFKNVTYPPAGDDLAQLLIMNVQFLCNDNIKKSMCIFNNSPELLHVKGQIHVRQLE